MISARSTRGLSRADRLGIAELLESEADEITRAATHDFLRRGPSERAWGERAQEHVTSNARFHMSFLVGAVAGGSPEAFAEYARWSKRMLASRGIPATALVGMLEDLRNAARSRVGTIARGMLGEMIDVGLAAARELPEAKPPRVAPEPGATSPLAWARDPLVDALLRGDRRAAADLVLDLVRSGKSLDDVYVDVVQAALVEIGERWELARISVAVEHRATAIMQTVLARASAERQPVTLEERGSIVVAGVAGELHQLGAQLVADVLEEDGWNVTFLGTNTPDDDILENAAEVRADVVGLSVTMLFDATRIVRLVASLRAQMPAVRIVVGGRALRIAPSLGEALGADAIARDAREAREACAERP